MRIIHSIVIHTIGIRFKQDDNCLIICVSQRLVTRPLEKQLENWRVRSSFSTFVSMHISKCAHTFHRSKCFLEAPDYVIFHVFFFIHLPCRRSKESTPYHNCKPHPFLTAAVLKGNVSHKGEEQRIVDTHRDHHTHSKAPTSHPHTHA